MSWTDETLARLKEYLEAGYSASQIATQINNEFGIRLSRNAIIGKYKRLGLNPAPRNLCKKTRASAQKAIKPPKPRVERKAPPAPIAPTMAVAPRVVANEPAPGARMLGILNLKSGQCRYPHDEKGEDGFTIFCAADIEPGSSYCPAHRKLCMAGTAPRVIMPGEAKTEVQQQRSDEARARMLAFHRKRAAGQQKAFA